MKNPASLSGLPPLLLVVIAWACVVGAVGVEGVAGGASQDSWGSCKTPVCGEVQRQAEALINLRLFRRYIAQTVLLINTQLGLLDEEVVKTAEGLTQFIGPQCPASHDLLIQVTQTENFNFITKDDVRDVLTDNPVEAESTTTQQIHDSHHINKVDQTEGQPYNSDEDSSPTTQQSEDYDTEDESQHLPATKHTTASGVSRNDLLELHGGSGKALIEHSSPKDVGSGSGIDSSSSTGKITTSTSKITTRSSSSSTQQSVYVAPSRPKEDGRGGHGVTVPGGSGGTFVTRGSSGVGRGTFVHGGSSGAGHGTFVDGESIEDSHGTFLPGRSSVDHGGGSRGSQGRGIHGGGSGGYGEGDQGNRGQGGGGRSIYSSGGHGGGSQGSRGRGRGGQGSGHDGHYSEWYHYCRGVRRGSPHWVPGLDEWCVINCANGHCPSTHCVC
ncbi:RNA-binding protein FUS [Cherax quadricarinatus]|uniref:RNA-binding protein FUS n=1 Tax=Cherax quadricarinatus TaxID=27406 RepID=UPI00387E760E